MCIYIYIYYIILYYIILYYILFYFSKDNIDITLLIFFKMCNYIQYLDILFIYIYIYIHIFNRIFKYGILNLSPLPPQTPHSPGNFFILAPHPPTPEYLPQTRSSPTRFYPTQETPHERALKNGCAEQMRPMS